MKPLRLLARNFGPYRTVDWAIPEGVTAIIGRNEAGEGISSNGAGKTMLLSILPLALWGPGSWADFVSAGSDEVCEIGCEFEHGGDVFRVRRTYSPGGRGKATLDFEMLAGRESGELPYAAVTRAEAGAANPGVVATPPRPASTLTRDSIAATQEAIRNLLGIGEATFHHSVFAAQGARHFADAELTPKERGEILADGLGLDVWDAFREAVAADRLAMEKELGALDAQIGAWDTQLADREAIEEAAGRAEAAVVILKQSLSEAREKHAALDNTYRTAREALAQCSAAEREADALLSTVRELEVRQAEAEQGAVELAQMRAELADAQERASVLVACADRVAELRGLEQAATKAEAERRDLSAEWVRLSAEAAVAEQLAAAKAEQHADLFTTGAGECERCGQRLAGGSFEEMLATLKAEEAEYAAIGKERREQAGRLSSQIETFTIPAAPTPAEIEQAETDLANARIAETQAARLAGRAESLSNAVAANSGPEHAARLSVAREAHTEAYNALETLRRMCKDESVVAELAKDTLGAQLAADRLDAELAEARTAHGTATERARALAAIAAENEAALATQAALRFEVDVLRELEKAYGRAGIPVLLLESLYVPQIERHANDVLAAWGVPYTVELVTQKALKTADRLRDTMEVVVHSPDGPRKFATYSGGERDRVSVALRIALARTIGSHRGHSLEVFALDELTHLDAAGVEKLAELLGELAREIAVVLFVSHSSDLNDAFDQRVTVVREGSHSRLEVAT